MDANGNCRLFHAIAIHGKLISSCRRFYKLIFSLTISYNASPINSNHPLLEDDVMDWKPWQRRKTQTRSINSKTFAAMQNIYHKISASLIFHGQKCTGWPSFAFWSKVGRIKSASDATQPRPGLKGLVDVAMMPHCMPDRPNVAPTRNGFPRKDVFFKMLRFNPFVSICISCLPNCKGLLCLKSNLRMIATIFNCSAFSQYMVHSFHLVEINEVSQYNSKLGKNYTPRNLSSNSMAR